MWPTPVIVVGAVISPRWIDNLDLVLDYWDVDLTGEINIL